MNKQENILYIDSKGCGYHIWVEVLEELCNGDYRAYSKEFKRHVIFWEGEDGEYVGMDQP